MVESTESLKDQLIAILDDKKAEQVSIIDLQKKSILADCPSAFFIPDILIIPDFVELDESAESNAGWSIGLFV